MSKKICIFYPIILCGFNLWYIYGNCITHTLFSSTPKWFCQSAWTFDAADYRNEKHKRHFGVLDDRDIILIIFVHSCTNKIFTKCFWQILVIFSGEGSFGSFGSSIFKIFSPSVNIDDYNKASWCCYVIQFPYQEFCSFVISIFSEISF